MAAKKLPQLKLFSDQVMEDLIVQDEIEAAFPKFLEATKDATFISLNKKAKKCTTLRSGGTMSTSSGPADQQ